MADAAAVAAAKQFYRGTRNTGLEIGAFILEKKGTYSVGFADQGNSQRRFITKEDIAYDQTQGYRVVSHMHSHPDRVDGDEMLEGLSISDERTSADLGFKAGDVVTGDGDVVKTTTPESGVVEKLRDLHNVTMKVIADVDRNYDVALRIRSYVNQRSQWVGATLLSFPYFKTR